MDMLLSFVHLGRQVGRSLRRLVPESLIRRSIVIIPARDPSRCEDDLRITGGVELRTVLRVEEVDEPPIGITITRSMSQDIYPGR